MGIDAGGVDGPLVALVGAACDGGEAVGLCVELVEGFLAGKGGLLEDGDLLLGDGLGALGDYDHVGAVLGVEHEGLVELCGNATLEAGDGVGLGEPAEVAQLAVCCGVLVCGVEGGEACEVATLGSHLLEAVGLLACV